MLPTFERVTKAALEEIVKTHAKESKFGLVLVQESVPRLVQDLYDLLLTSRSLKSAGDRLLAQGPPTSTQPPRSSATRSPRG